METLNPNHLHASILSAATPPQVASALASLSAFLLRRPPSDHLLRPFFSLAFPSLLRRLFGFDSPSSSWLLLAASDHHLSSHLFRFLSPAGPLFSAISSLDHRSLVTYIFPLERLPHWMRHVLQLPFHSPTSLSADALASLSPLFSSRLKHDPLHNLTQMHLNIFQYYVFWFAYYPLSQLSSSSSPSSSATNASLPAPPKTRLEHWVSSIPTVISSTAAKPPHKPHSTLYLRLLYSYLKAFVPNTASPPFLPYHTSLLNYSTPTHHHSAYLQAEFLIQTFVQFWMVDNDFSPLPLQLLRSSGLTFPYQLFSTAPPSPGLADVLKLLVTYLHSYPAAPQTGYAHMMFRKSLQRPLYRFILRTFLYCPIGASINNSLQVFYLWITYIQPWNNSNEDFRQLESTKDQTDEGNHIQKGYTVAWRDYVLDNYLFYSLMVVHFLEFAHRFIHTDVESVIKMVSQVLEVLCSSTELLALLCQVDTIYHSRQAGSTSYTSNDLYKYIPSIHEQLQDWEDGIMENDVNGSLHERSIMNLRFFSDREDGAYSLLQLLLLRAEYEIQLLSGDVSRHLQHLDSVKAKVIKLFGKQIVKTPVKVSPRTMSMTQKDTFTPRRPKVDKYKGDWMKRPISNSEVAWLAVLLIRVSDWLNQHLALDGNVETDEVGPTYVEVKGDGFKQINGAKEFLWLLFMLVFSWLVVICNLVLGFMKRRGMKISLRVLASKKLSGIILVIALWPLVSRCLSGVTAVLGFS